MLTFDIHAQILPGKSAAGFPIGLLFDEFVNSVKCQRCVQDGKGFNLVAAIQENVGVLRVDGLYGSGPTIFFKNDIVRLDFSLKGVLACIYMFDG